MPPRRPKVRAYVAALPLSEVPELQKLLGRFCGLEGERANVVMMRLADPAMARLDQLVEAGLFGSRSEAAAFLVGAGIDAQAELFNRIGKHSAEMKRIRQSLRQVAIEALRSTSRTGAARSTRRRSPERDRQ
jgi:Arc/MetJ-type ribon-helix-helix transcriptional regulator